ncbi:MAG: hypothetical protein JKY94_11240 [Rhodobacteraceae bacterium]|nr:hypothetical protein [Paracoccaceae bacterium]
MSRGSKIAAKVAKGIAKAGAAVGDGPLVCTLKRPAIDTRTPSEVEAGATLDPTLHGITAVQSKKQIRDAAGTLTGKTMTVLTVSATGVTPLKSDLIVVGVALADIVAETVFIEIAKVEPLAPGGVAVLFKVTLAD